MEIGLLVTEAKLKKHLQLATSTGPSSSQPLMQPHAATISLLLYTQIYGKSELLWQSNQSQINHLWCHMNRDLLHRFATSLTIMKHHEAGSQSSTVVVQQVDLPLPLLLSCACLRKIRVLPKAQPEVSTASGWPRHSLHS